MDWAFTDTALRLLAALAAGGLIGVNRDMHGKPTGVRLHALVALGAATLTIVGVELGGKGDPHALSRIIQGIVGGIGFLGAGVILREADKGRVQHMATAASIWITAALGVAAGAGLWPLVSLAALGTLVILIFGMKLDKALYGRFREDD